MVPTIRRQNIFWGDVDVDVEAIDYEATIVNDHVRMLFWAFSVLLLIPLNFLYPADRKWSRISSFCAGAMRSVWLFRTGAHGLRSSWLSSRARLAR